MAPEAGGIGRHEKIAGRDLFVGKKTGLLPQYKGRSWWYHHLGGQQSIKAGLGQFHGKSLSNNAVLIESTPNYRLKDFLFRGMSS